MFYLKVVNKKAIFLFRLQLECAWEGRRCYTEASCCGRLRSRLIFPSLREVGDLRGPCYGLKSTQVGESGKCCSGGDSSCRAPGKPAEAQVRLGCLPPPTIWLPTPWACSQVPMTAYRPSQFLSGPSPLSDFDLIRQIHPQKVRKIR